MTMRVKWAVKMAIGATALATAFLLIPSARAQDAAEKTFKAKCASCHAADGSGSPVGKKLGARDFRSPEVQQQSDAQLVEIVAKGKNKMPGYAKTLKDAEIKELIAYVRELAKGKK